MISPINPQPEAAVPFLHDGDRLTMEEFERRWDAMPNLKHAELIEGQVYMNAAALRWDWHSEPHGLLVSVMTHYARVTDGVLFGSDPSVRMNPSSMPQPDAVLRVSEKIGGLSQIQKGYVVGRPEFVIEVSGSTDRHDLGAKKTLYLNTGVPEYLNWSVPDEQIVLFRLQSSSYEKVAEDHTGILKSLILPGLWFDPAALIRGDRPRIYEVMDMGIASPEHKEFVQELTRRRESETSR